MGGINTKTNTHKLPIKELMARKREVLRLRGKNLEYNEIARQLGMKYEQVTKTCRLLEPLVEENPNTLWAHLSQPAMRAIYDAFGLTNPSLADLQEVMKRKHRVHNPPGMVEWRVKLLRTRGCHVYLLKEIEDFCTKNGIKLKEIVKTSTFIGMSVEAHNAIQKALGRLPDPRHLALVVRERKGRDRLFNAAPTQEAWEEIKEYCRDNGIFLRSHENMQKTG